MLVLEKMDIKLGKMILKVVAFVIRIFDALFYRNFNGSNLVRFFFMLVLPGTLFTFSVINEMVNLLNCFEFNQFSLLLCL